MKGISFRAITQRNRQPLTGKSTQKKGSIARFALAVALLGLFVVVGASITAIQAPHANSALLSEQSRVMPAAAGEMAPGGVTADGYGRMDQAPTDGANAPSAGGTSSASTTTLQKDWDRMLVRTAALQVAVKDVGSGVDAVITAATNHGGRVLTLNSQQNGEYETSSVTIQVPSQEFDRILPDLRKLNGQVKKVLSENVSSEDVTEEYTDLQSQLRNLQATESRMLALQAKAEKLEDILTLDRELRQVRADIERIQGRTTYLSKRSEMSQITVTLSPEAAIITPLATPDQGWNPGQVVAQAWNASLDLLAKVATAVLTVAVFLWWLFPLLLLGYWFTRRTNRGPVPPAAEPTA